MSRAKIPRHQFLGAMASSIVFTKPVALAPHRIAPRINGKGAPKRVTAPWRNRGGGRVAMHPLGASDGEYYEGQFGTWKLEPEDRLEVQLYRAGLTVAAVCLNLGVVGSFVTNGDAMDNDVYNVLSVLGAGALGLSFVQIHIYVASLKRFVQGLWAVGTTGGLALMLTQDQTLPAYVVDHPAAGWLVGPLFAAVTGLAFKEGLCYGKWEAALIFLLVPILILGHIAGLLPDEAQHTMVGAFAILFTIFAARKYTQPIKDDIGDKTIFEFQALTEEEQDAMLKELEPK